VTRKGTSIDSSAKKKKEGAGANLIRGASLSYLQALGYALVLIRLGVCAYVMTCVLRGTIASMFYALSARKYGHLWTSLALKLGLFYILYYRYRSGRNNPRLLVVRSASTSLGRDLQRLAAEYIFFAVG
jgi:hypothetical protein